MSYADWCQQNLDKFSHSPGKKWAQARCPLHRDDKPSLGVDLDGGGYSCKSFSCPNPKGTLRALAERAGLPMVGLPEPASTNGKAHKVPQRDFFYPSASGEPIGKVTRYWDNDLAKKGFWQYHWESGAWVSGKGNVPFPIFRAAEIAEASQDLVLWVEGEKCAEFAVRLGFEATTSAQGATRGSFQLTDKESLKLLYGKRVVVIPDNDEAGRSYANVVVEALLPIAREIHILELPGLEPKGDIADWITKGGTAEALLNLLSPTIPAEPKKEQIVVPWPERMANEAFHGILGKIVSTVEPHTEGDPCGLLGQLLCVSGHLIGGGPWYQIESTRHRSNLFAMTAGSTGAGRKGTCWDRACEVARLAFAAEEQGLQLQSGYGSGEGLVDALADKEGEE